MSSSGGRERRGRARSTVRLPRPRTRMSRLALLLLLCSSGCRAGEGQDLLASGDAARGFEFVRVRGCTSCHASASLAAEPAPRLEQVGARLTPHALEASLTGGASMPDCLGSLSRKEREGASAALTHYLASLANIGMLMGLLRDYLGTLGDDPLSMIGLRLQKTTAGERRENPFAMLMSEDQRASIGCSIKWRAGNEPAYA